MKIINRLCADLIVWRLSLVERGLESIAYNLNRKSGGLQFFGFGEIVPNRGRWASIRKPTISAFSLCHREDSGKTPGKEKVPALTSII